MNRERRFRRIGLVACLALSTLLIGPPARADEKSALAQELFDTGRSLVKQGKVAEGCPKLEESQRLDPQIGTLFFLADCQEQLDLRASAWANFLEVAAKAKAAGRTGHAQEAQERADGLKGRINKLLILLPDDLKGVPGLEIRRGDIVLGPAQLGVALPVDNGKHVIKVSATGRRPWTTTVEIGGEGSSTTVSVPPLVEEPALGPVTSSAPAATGAPTAAQDAPWPTAKKAGLGAAITGGVSLAAGAIFGGLAASALSSSDAECLPEDRTQCTPKGVALGNDARTFGTLSTALIVAGGVLAAGGVTLFVLAPGASEPNKPARTEPKPSLKVSAGPTSVVIRGNW